MKSTHTEKDGGKKIFIIETNSITPEAQNALLKVFEEPQANAHFFVIIPSAEILLPTLRSRMMILRHTAGQNGNTNDTRASHDMQTGATGGFAKSAEAFIKMPLKDRIKFADDLAADISDEKKTKQDAMHFLSGLEVVLALSFKKNTEQKKLSSKLEAVIRTRDYMQDRSPSIKQLLEYVALSV
jgi:hypothetical protein